MRRFERASRNSCQQNSPSECSVSFSFFSFVDLLKIWFSNNTQHERFYYINVSVFSVISQFRRNERFERVQRALTNRSNKFSFFSFTGLKKGMINITVSHNSQKWIFDRIRVRIHWREIEINLWGYFFRIFGHRCWRSILPSTFQCTSNCEESISLENFILFSDVSYALRIYVLFRILRWLS